MENTVNMGSEEETKVCEVCGEPLYRYSESWKSYVPKKCKCRRDEFEAEKKREDERRERDRRENARRLCFADKKNLAKFTFDNFDRENGNALEVKERCVGYAENFSEMKKDGIGLFIFGDIGTGKTHLAAATCNRLIDSRPGFKALFTSFGEVSDKLISRDAGFEEKLEKCDLVVFDDFGAEFRTKLSEEKIREAVNLRVNAGLPMIVTSNYTKERMMKPENDFEKNVFSRFYGACDSVHIIAKDFRKRKYTERKKGMN